MASIEIFKCDICAKEVRMENGTQRERSRIELVIDVQSSPLFGGITYVPQRWEDCCESCSMEIHSAIGEIAERLRSAKKVSQ